jgi:hypothetical protein
MAIANSYFNSSPITDSDIFVGTKYSTNRTVNYTAQSIADYLNVNARISISGQLTFKFTILPNVAKTIAFENGGGDGRLFSSIDKLIVSILDAGGSNITVFLDYLIDSEILLAEQNQPNSFGHYKITSYTVTANPNFYELNLEYIGGNGNIYKDVYYDMTPWASSGGIGTTPNLQQVTDEGNTTTNDIIVTGATGTDILISSQINSSQIAITDGTAYVALAAQNDGAEALILLGSDLGFAFISPGGAYFSDDVGNANILSGRLELSSSNPEIILTTSSGFTSIKTDLITTSNLEQQLPNASGTIALTSDITTPTLQEVTDEGATTTNGITLTNDTVPLNIGYDGASILTFTDNDINVSLGFSGLNFTDSTGSYGSISIGAIEFLYNNKQTNYNSVGVIFRDSITNYDLNINYPASIVGSEKTQTFQDADGTIALTSDIPAAGVTSVGLTMPSAFSVTNSPITSSGDIAVTGAGLVSQYVRGDGTLANFPNSTGGGSSVNYYLNGSVSQGTFGGDVYYQMSKTPILGAGTNFTRTNGSGNGYIASFITDVADPSQLNIPGGNWNVEFYFNASSGGGSPSFYAELYKVSATNVFTLIASDSLNPEGITNGTTVDQYFTSIPVPQTTLLATDRLAIRIFVNTGGRTITLHTENGNLSEVLTTFTTGLTALNGLTAQVQYFYEGTNGTDFNISSTTDTHTFNLPTASATNRGALSSADWTIFNNKQNDLETFYKNQGVFYFQDFLNGPLVATIEGVDISTRVTSGGSGGETIGAATTWPNRTNQQGVLQLVTGANATGQLVIRVGSFNSATGMFFGNGEVVFEAYVNVDTLSTAAQRFADWIGWSTTIGVATAASYQFIYDEGGVSTNGGAASSNWKCCSFNGTTRVNTDTGVAVVAGQWYKLRIVVNAANTQINYLIDGTNVATHTSGVGVSVMAAKVVHTKSIGTTNRIFYIDYLMIKQTFTTPR